MRKYGAFCCGYSNNRLRRFLRWASSLFLNALTVEGRNNVCGQVTPHIHYLLWLKVNLRRSSLDIAFLSFRECPRSLELSAIWKKSRH